MQPLLNKNVVLGVSGGIAAYKTPDLVRRLKEAGADVRVVLTRGGEAFVTPLSLQAVSANPVSTDLLDPTAEAAMGHIELAKWADIILVAPASANIIARLANGLADDLLTTLVLATTAKVAIAPAMNQQMWAASVVQENTQRLATRGVNILGPASGSQACGDVGEGRMCEPTDLRDQLINLFEQQSHAQHQKLWNNARITITAGPTREAIDPVRYISNHSSGKMGYALAAAAARTGAQVTLISGPVSLEPPAGVTLIAVETAEQMLAATEETAMDVFIGCAAVSDYRPAEVASQKIKKEQQQGAPSLSLIKNPDVLKTIATSKQPPFCIGFAAETNNLREHALAKLDAKKLKLIVANDVSDKTIGFNSEQNAVTVYWQDGKKAFSAQNKTSLAEALNQLFAEHFFNENK
ncbi:bifunctional phosphopantothenoylcysteine decarboxylase/phosphopantothenate--cysteine ligase CoaBC [Idiomarina seosinensis]|uniref:Coenzyme A biosynthesis bifunctional protein CoaBC n=1 Tax=Idiomarina seosinensis TaxID=281739 RepID=A0A432ZDJ7_9GAMM|nr:bifunctional phosphopantothenoylcysteine decarboxylase/phosphopantothenate--cysteine ligase CoaBC [Idiomarina seosinensis]RUO76043.1 bifunctional phosphopantothenoylcysteine decarboxylase/phosphopantothenate--cysteine ligase CoaBC [Idiomarina seosinensis]